MPKAPKPKRLCTRCDKPLVPVGDRRKGGTRRHFDWDTREFHKKCWKLECREARAAAPAD
jgi:hypothetical protein